MYLHINTVFSCLLLGFVLLFESLELLRIDGWNGHVCKVVVLVQKMLCVVVNRARDTQQQRETEHIAFEKGFTGPDHGRRHLPRAGVLVLGRIQNHTTLSSIYVLSLLLT